jgi:hypothetical protein
MLLAATWIGPNRWLGLREAALGFLCGDFCEPACFRATSTSTAVPPPFFLSTPSKPGAPVPPSTLLPLPLPPIPPPFPLSLSAAAEARRAAEEAEDLAVQEANPRASRAWAKGGDARVRGG